MKSFYIKEEQTFIRALMIIANSKQEAESKYKEMFDTMQINNSIVITNGLEVKNYSFKIKDENEDIRGINNYVYVKDESKNENLKIFYIKEYLEIVRRVVIQEESEDDAKQAYCQFDLNLNTTLLHINCECLNENDEVSFNITDDFEECSETDVNLYVVYPN